MKQDSSIFKIRIGFEFFFFFQLFSKNSESYLAVLGIYRFHSEIGGGVTQRLGYTLLRLWFKPFSFSPRLYMFEVICTSKK